MIHKMIHKFIYYVFSVTTAFRIEVKMADKLWTGTEISMSGPISGETKSTGMMKLDAKRENDHERGNLYKYVIVKCPEPLEIIESLTVSKKGMDDWNLDYIKGMVSFLHTICKINMSPIIWLQSYRMSHITLTKQ